MSEKNIDIQIIKPFGPPIVKVKIPEQLIDKINEYVDNISQDKEKSKELDHGSSLAGNVTQEFKLEPNFMKEIKWGEFLGNIVAQWIFKSINKKVTKFQITSSWIVRQFQNEHNPIHWHGGHISGVGYLKVPNNFGETIQSKKVNSNGRIELIHGSRNFLTDSTYRIKPVVGDLYLFPNFLMHTVYPFQNKDGERRSISFNSRIDSEIYDVYGNY